MPWLWSEFTRMRSPAASAAQHPARLEGHIVRGAVLHLQRLRLVVAVIEVPGHLVQPLVQRAAEGDIHLLEAAADAEYRDAGMHGLADKGQRRGIARRVMQRPRLARRPLVALRLDVRGAAGKEQPVEALEQLLEPELLGERGDEQRGRTGRIEHGPRVLLPDHVERLCTDHAPVGRNTNEWAGGCHGGLAARCRLIS